MQVCESGELLAEIACAGGQNVRVGTCAWIAKDRFDVSVDEVDDDPSGSGLAAPSAALAEKCPIPLREEANVR